MNVYSFEFWTSVALNACGFSYKINHVSEEGPCIISRIPNFRCLVILAQDDLSSIIEAGDPY